MRVAITGSGGNVGRGIAPLLREDGYELACSDAVALEGVERVDVTDVEALTAYLRGADVLLHLPAWHGIHVSERSESEFWDLNVGGTFTALQAARAAGVRRVVWLSSQTWHDKYGKYGFTKVIGELLLEYHRRNHGTSFVAVRPGNFTPWTDWVHDYGRGLLYGRVDRVDVLQAVRLAVDYVIRSDAGLVLDAVAPNIIQPEVLASWAVDPTSALVRAFPEAEGWSGIDALDLRAVPIVHPTSGWAEVGFTPRVHFGTWLREVKAATQHEIACRTSHY